jgi:hypothetical protein
MQGDQGHLQAHPLHIYCYVLHVGEFNSLLHVGVEAVDEAHAGERDLSNQGPAPLGDS